METNKVGKRIIILLIILLCAFLKGASAETVIKQEVTVTFPDATRTGFYSGEINENGNPDGFGVFDAVNSEGNRYIIVGEWVDGSLTGEGWELWNNGDFNIGQFDNGHFVSGKYARDVKVQEYSEQPQKTETEDTNSNMKSISYEALTQYGDLFDPESGYVTKGSIPVQIEAIIAEISDYSYDDNPIKMWIKGEKGYYYYETKLYKDIPIYSEEPIEFIEPKQRITMILTPYSDGSFRNNCVQSISILERDIDLKEIVPAEIKTYEEYFGNTSYGKEKSVLDIIVDDYPKLWVKSDNGYTSIRKSIGFLAEKGQRFYVVAEPDDGKFAVGGEVLSLNSVSKVLIEENVDVKPLEDAEREAYLKADQERRERAIADWADGSKEKRLLEPFDENAFADIPYKRILRNISEQAGMAIRIDGKYKQKIDSENALIADNDGNYYHLYIMNWPIEVLDFTILENDRITVYGFVEEEAYKYTSWTGEKTVPSIYVRHIELHEEE